MQQPNIICLSFCMHCIFFDIVHHVNCYFNPHISSLKQLWFCICWCREEDESRIFWTATAAGNNTKLEYRTSEHFVKSFLELLCLDKLGYSLSFLQVRVGGVIVIDNVLWHGKVADPLVNCLPMIYKNLTIEMKFYIFI